MPDDKKDTLNKVLYCTSCLEDTLHLDLGKDVPAEVRFKCTACGEYFVEFELDF